MCLLFSGRDETQQSAHCSHHFKQRVCLCLLSQCRVLRKAARILPCMGGSCWSSGHPQSATFALPCGNALFHVFAFFFVFRFFEGKKNAGHSATKGARHEVLHQILWRDNSASHQFFFCVGH